MASALSIPESLDDITAEWLTSALRSQGHDVEMAGVVLSPVPHGKGMMSELGIFDVTYASGTGPASVVAKIAAVNEANRAVGVAFNCYERETRFLRDVAPKTSAALPKLYYADVDPPERFVIVMEDLSDYRVGDQLEGCSTDEAELGIRELGKLHSAFWDNVARPELDFIPYHYPSIHSDGLQQGAAAGWDNMVALFGHTVPDYLRNAKDRYLAAIPRMQEWITTAPITVVHGDFRMDNIFFGQQPGQHPFVVCDLQGCLRGKGVQDLAYLLSQSVHVEDRREHERDLVKLWQDQLVLGGVADYSPEQAWDDYERAVLYLWTYVAVIGGSLDPVNERGMGWMQQMVTRSATAIDDLGLFGRLAEFK